MYINLDDVVKQLEVAGLVIDKSLRFDSVIQRWRAEGEDHEKRGWSRLREWTSKSGATYIVGDYGVWHGNDDGRIRVELPAKDGDKPALSQEDIAAMREAHKEAQRRIAQTRLAEAKTAARWASVVWSSCAPVADHDYLTRKQIKPHGLRILGDSADILLTGIDESNIYRLKQADGALVVPMHDEHGNVCGLQFIYPAGHPRRIKIERDKEFWPSGMGMGGTFGLIGHVRRDGVLLIAEGYATAASLHETTGQAVAYAFSANNLGKAGKLLRKHYAKLKILFCADDDYLTDGNPGISAASKASAEIEGSNWTKPDFTNADGIDQRNGKKLTDYNDLAALTGLPLVLANQINAKLDSLNWRDALATCAGSSSEGSGEGRKAAVSIMTLDEAVGRFVPIDDGKGKCLFDLWRKDLVHRDQMAALMPAGSKGDDIKRHPVWIERGSYYVDQIGFDPSGEDEYVKLNTWKGWPLKAKKGNYGRILELIHYLCNGEGKGEEIGYWLLCWMAYPLQHPGAKMASAVIMHGLQGTGKSMVFKALAKIYGMGHPYRDYSVVLDQKALQDNFNADWENKLFVLAEEVVNSSDKWQLKNELKELVTGERLRIRKVFTDAYRQKNQLQLAFLSNEGMPLPLDNDDRRHLVIWTPPPLTKQYYLDVQKELDTGGVAAFYHYLLNLDLGDFGPHTPPPMTIAKHDLIALSKASDDRFIDEWEEGQTSYPLVPCGSGQIYSAYEAWCKTNGERHPRRAPDFISKIGRRVGWSNAKHHRYDNTHYMGKTRPLATIMPPSATAPSDKTQSQWLTDCFFEFQQALTGAG
jgi:putative DNA primase/helicase